MTSSAAGRVSMAVAWCVLGAVRGVWGEGRLGGGVVGGRGLLSPVGLWGL